MRDHYRDLPKSYYRRDHVYDFGTFFRSIRPDTYLLNLGCGRGESLLSFDNGVGVDFNDSLLPMWKQLGLEDRCMMYDVADGLPWPDKEFDYTISVDFLEHVQPEHVEDVVAEIIRLAPRGRHVIDTKPESAYRGPAGENLHPSANSPTFWENAFRGVGARYKLRGAFMLVSW